MRKQEEAGESQKQILEQKRIWRGKCYEAEFALAYIRFPEEMQTDVNSICEYLEADTKSLGKQNVITSLNQIYFENRGFLNEYQVMQGELFKELDENRPLGEAEAVRQDFTARYQGIKLPFSRLLAHLEEDIAQLQDLIKAGDRELFEDILANMVSRKIRGKINASNAWVEKMNAIVYTSNTGSTAKYAKLLSHQICVPSFSMVEAKTKVKPGAEIIYMGWIMAGKIKGYPEAARKYNIQAVCGVGMGQTGTQLVEIRTKNKVPQRIPLFTLQGTFDVKKLHGVYKMMMNVMVKTAGKALADKSDRTPEDDDMLDMMLNGSERVKAENLKHIIDWYDTAERGEK